MHSRLPLQRAGLFHNRHTHAKAAPDLSPKCSDSPLRAQSSHNLDATHNMQTHSTAQCCAPRCTELSQDTLAIQIHFTKTTLLRVITQCTQARMPPNTHTICSTTPGFTPSHADCLHTKICPSMHRTPAKYTHLLHDTHKRH